MFHHFSVLCRDRGERNGLLIDKWTTANINMRVPSQCQISVACLLFSFQECHVPRRTISAGLLQMSTVTSVCWAERSHLRGELPTLHVLTERSSTGLLPSPTAPAHARTTNGLDSHMHMKSNMLKSESRNISLVYLVYFELCFIAIHFQAGGC